MTDNQAKLKVLHRIQNTDEYRVRKHYSTFCIRVEIALAGVEIATAGKCYLAIMDEVTMGCGSTEAEAWAAAALWIDIALWKIPDYTA